VRGVRGERAGSAGAAGRRSQGCWRHCSALARLRWSNSSMGCRKSANCPASSAGHSYFSISTARRFHGFSLEMLRSSPEQRCFLSHKLTGSSGTITVFGKVLPLVFALREDVLGYGTQKLDDVRQVVLVARVAVARVRLEQVITRGKLESLEANERVSKREKGVKHHASGAPDVRRAVVAGADEHL